MTLYVMKRSDILTRVQGIEGLLSEGCSDNSCTNPNKKRGGQGTNSSCRCQPINIAELIEILYEDTMDIKRQDRWEK